MYFYLIVFALLCFQSVASYVAPVKDYCDSRQCVIVASEIDTAIDQSLDPCEDFYGYVCGSFLENTVLHDRHGQQYYDNDLKDRERNKIKNLIEKVDDSNENGAFKLLRTFYRTCLNQNAINQVGREPLLDAIESFGGWPLMNKEWKANGLTWIDIDNRVFQAGFTENYLIKVYTGGDRRDHNRNTVVIESPDHSPLGPFYDDLIEGLKSDKIQAYYDYMVNLTTLLGAEKVSAKEEMLKVLNFEIELHKLTKLEGTGIRYLTLDEMNTKFPYLNWTSLLNIRLEGAAPFDGKTDILNGELNFFASLGDLLASTPIETLANFFAWRALDSTKTLIGDRYYQPSLDFFLRTRGYLRVEEGWKRCIYATKKFFNVALGALNARANKVVVFNDMATIIAIAKTEVFTYARDNLNVTSKMADSIAKRLRDTKIHYEQPKEYFDDLVLEDYYKDVNMIEGQHYKNVLRMQTFLHQKVGLRLTKPLDDTFWETYNQEYFDDTYYDNGSKYIFLSSSEFHSPIYDRALPSYLNYAGLGYKVVKFLTYALFNEVSDYEVESLITKSECVDKQYVSYVESIFKMKISATKTSRQNIADLLGFELSYKTYKTWQTMAIKRPVVLPGLNFTPEQLFWISASQRFCSVDRNIVVKRRKILSDTPIESFRVLNSLRNNGDFAKDFECPSGSPMNIANKC